MITAIRSAFVGTMTGVFSGGILIEDTSRILRVLRSVSVGVLNLKRFKKLAYVGVHPKLKLNSSAEFSQSNQIAAPARTSGGMMTSLEIFR